MWTPKFQCQFHRCARHLFTHIGLSSPCTAELGGLLTDPMGHKASDIYCLALHMVCRILEEPCFRPNSLEFNSRASWDVILWSVTLQVPLNFKLTFISIKYIIHMGREEAIVRDKKCKGKPNHINFKISLSEKKKKKNWTRETDYTGKWDSWKISILNIITTVVWFQKL